MMLVPPIAAPLPVGTDQPFECTTGVQAGRVRQHNCVMPQQPNWWSSLGNPVF